MVRVKRCTTQACKLCVITQLEKRPRTSGKELARIENTLRVENLPNAAHQRNFRRTARAFQIGALDQTNAMFGRNTAAMFLQRFGEPFRNVFALRNEIDIGKRIGLQHIDMQVAVTDVTKPHHFDMRVFARKQ